MTARESPRAVPLLASRPVKKTTSASSGASVMGGPETATLREAGEEIQTRQAPYPRLDSYLEPKVLAFAYRHKFHPKELVLFQVTTTVSACQTGQTLTRRFAHLKVQGPCSPGKMSTAWEEPRTKTTKTDLSGIFLASIHHNHHWRHVDVLGSITTTTNLVWR